MSTPRRRTVRHGGDGRRRCTTGTTANTSVDSLPCGCLGVTYLRLAALANSWAAARLLRLLRMLMLYATHVLNLLHLLLVLAVQLLPLPLLLPQKVLLGGLDAGGGFRWGRPLPEVLKHARRTSKGRGRGDRPRRNSMLKERGVRITAGGREGEKRERREPAER